MSEKDSFKSWEFIWKKEHIQRFWDWQGRNSARSRLYFSRLVGDAILDKISQHVPLSGTVVDWGSGPGFLVEKLIERSVDTIAVDASIESVNLLNERFTGKPHFLGAEAISTEKAAIDDEIANVVLLIETVEHLDDETLTGVLSEIYRILKPAGTIVVTVPNHENLADNQMMCPNCGCVFHIVQHVRSLSPTSLSNIMKTAGFSEIISKPTLFSWHRPIIRPIHRLKYLIKRENLPHLLYIGKK